MKQFFTAAALCTLVAMSGSAFAQDAKVMTTEMNGQKMILVAKDASSTDMYKARWAFYNADQREINRFKTKGFSESDFKAICNIALRTGLDTDYIARQVSEVGHPLTFVAAWYGVATTALDDDIPGFGATSLGVVPKDMMSKPMSTSGSNSMTSGTIIDVAMADPQFSTLVAAIKAAGLVDTLSGAGPFTVFAPTNEAFAKLPAGALDDLLKPENKARLVSLLTYHVIPGKIKAADVMGMSNPSMPTTVNGKQLNIKTTSPLMVDSANIIKADVEASNGVIHVIDTVLMPAN